MVPGGPWEENPTSLLMRPSKGGKISSTLKLEGGEVEL